MTLKICETGFCTTNVAYMLAAVDIFVKVVRAVLLEGPLDYRDSEIFTRALLGVLLREVNQNVGARGQNISPDKKNLGTRYHLPCQLPYTTF